MEDEEDGVLSRKRVLLDNVVLSVLENFRSKLDITRSVDTVDVTEGGGDAESGGDAAELFPDLADLLGLRVEGGVVDASVIDTIFLTTGDTDFHLEEDADLVASLEVLLGDLDVVVELLGGEIDHVRGEEGLAGLLEVGLISVEAAIEPRKELLGAVVGVEDDGDSVEAGDGVDVLGTSDSTLDGGVLVLALDALTAEEGGTTVGELDDDGGVDGSGTLQDGVDGGGAGAVEGGDGESLLLSIAVQLLGFVTSEDTRM